ncbi:hypothetical protein ANO11243_056520 [Dothideomycetidae sp. 11243]|nr:hypothetical protein ANO11243_056520 [fungal sp. No.11243]
MVVNRNVDEQLWSALFAVSTLTSKLVYLLPHLTSPASLLSLFPLPTILVQDFLVIIGGCIILGRYSQSWYLSAASVTLGFLVAADFDRSGVVLVRDWDGVHLLLSGTSTMVTCSLAIMFIAFLTKSVLYDRIGWVAARLWQGLRMDLPVETAPAHKEGKGQRLHSCSSSLARFITHLPLFVRLFLAAALLQVLRLDQQSKGPLADTLLISLLSVFTKSQDQQCIAGAVGTMPPFPFPREIAQDTWSPKCRWPVRPIRQGEAKEAYPDLGQWKSPISDFDHSGYFPELDPLKLSNLDKDILDPLKDCLKHSATKIKHIILLTLESTRADVFPLTTDSHLFETLLGARSAPLSLQDFHLRVAGLSPVAELLTGTTNSSAFRGLRKVNDPPQPGSWRSRMGTTPSSINFVAASSTSSMTLKSILGSHCGVHPLPVEFTEESKLEPYQPCLPHVFSLLSNNKTDLVHGQDSAENDLEMHNARWRSVYAQSSTDQLDGQSRLNSMMGFAAHNTFVRANLTDPASNYSPPTEPMSSYFAYPESQLAPYLYDLFKDIQSKSERLFLSHLTSQTHHPFKIPKSFGRNIEYMGRNAAGKRRALNDYLNSIRYQDQWLGQIMDLLDETGMTNETLIVLVGDHGMAFAEDSPKHTTFENPHLSNFRVPLTFHHPSFPPLQLASHATNLDILPTILDLLVLSDSLSATDARIVKDILPRYQGQSLVRPPTIEDNGRELWAPFVINNGGNLIVIGSAASFYRLAIPLCKAGEYRFTDLSHDPNELSPITARSMETLLQKIYKQTARRHLSYDREELRQVIEWLKKAEQLSKWWQLEMRRVIRCTARVGRRVRRHQRGIHVNRHGSRLAGASHEIYRTSLAIDRCQKS